MVKCPGFFKIQRNDDGTVFSTQNKIKGEKFIPDFQKHKNLISMACLFADIVSTVVTVVVVPEVVTLLKNIFKNKFHEDELTFGKNGSWNSIRARQFSFL